MKQIFYLALTVFLFACESDETPVIASHYWDATHTTLMGLNGEVSRLVEITSPIEESADEEEETRVEATFNVHGQLTYFNPTGIGPETLTRWIGVASVRYYYHYDNLGRMAQVEECELGVAPNRYTLTYGEHHQYVPLLFPVGTLDFFLVKGLSSIKSDDGSVEYCFDGTKASYRKSSWGGVTEVSYEYASGSIYPICRKAQTLRNEVLLQTEVTDYLFDKQGTLMSSIKVTKDAPSEEVLEQTTIRYAVGGYPLIASKELESDGERTEWRYIYGQHGLLAGVVCSRNGETISEEETFSFSEIDAYGNWTNSRQQLSSAIDWGHQDGLFRVRREISYR